jgi:hypothetical protein
MNITLKDALGKERKKLRAECVRSARSTLPNYSQLGGKKNYDFSGMVGECFKTVST